MSFAEQFFNIAVLVALGILCISLLLITVRIIQGPTLPDRILGLDMLVAVGIGFIAVIGVKTGFTLYLDIAIALGLVGFLATIAFARYVLARGTAGDQIAGETPLQTQEKIQEWSEQE